MDGEGEKVTAGQYLRRASWKAIAFSSSLQRRRISGRSIKGLEVGVGGADMFWKRSSWKLEVALYLISKGN